MRLVPLPVAARAFALLVPLALLSAGCAALAAEEPRLEIRIAPYREGDVLRYDENWTWHEDGVPQRAQDGWVIEWEGAATAVDRFGVARNTTSVRLDWLSDGRAHAASRCHVLRDGAEMVREDVLWGRQWENAEMRVWGNPLPSPSTSSWAATTYFRGTCSVLPNFGGVVLREGERIAAADVNVANWYPWVRGLSSPGERTTFHDRPALAFSFAEDAAGRAIRSRFVAADGLPGFVDVRVEVPERKERSTYTLVGFAPGDGPAVASGPARLPAAREGAAFAPFAPLRLDDRPWNLSFPYDEALAALRANPQVGADAWLAEHEDAVLWFASYGEGRLAADVDGPSDVWIFAFVSPDGHLFCRIDAYAREALPLTAPPATRANCGTNAATWQIHVPDAFPENFPARVATGATIAEAAAGAGVPPDAVRGLMYFHWEIEGVLHPQVAVSSVTYNAAGDAEGPRVMVDSYDAALSNLYTVGHRTSVDALVQPGTIAEREAAAPAMPGAGGTAVAAGAGIVALVVLLKLAVALYTRLARDRLLENPVRARLYERIRAEPGIHREELIDFAGIGNGATRHHLRKLVAHGFALEISSGGFARYYAAGEVTPAAAREHALLRSGRARDVYDLYAAEPTLSLREAARRLDMSAPSVHRVRRRLAAAGLLPASGPGH